MNSIVRVVVNVPGLKNLYDYEVPESFGKLKEGSLVIVPFGKIHAQAVVLQEIDHSEVEEIKKISGVIDAEPVLTPQQMQLADWMAEHFIASISNCIHLMLPAGMNQMADVLYSIKKPLQPGEKLSTLQQKILKDIRKRGSMRARQIRSAYSHENWKASVRLLLKNGILESKSVLPDPRVHRKKIRTAQVVQSPEQIDQRQNELGKAGSAVWDRRKAAIDFLLQEGVPVNVAWIYASSGANAADLKILEEKGFIHLSEMDIWRDPLEHVEVSPASAPELTPMQYTAWEKIQSSLENDKESRPILIHGVTGSGKTELYIRTVEAVIKKGKQVLVLVPEISLTPQTVKRFMARFPGQVGLVHSRLSIGERYDTWLRARMGKISIIIGPRSALFSPLSNLGLIVVDEFHDGSFYQGENAPFYDAVQTAIAYTKIINCPLLLGSATPDIGMFFKAQSEGWEIIHLPDRILAHQDYIKQKAAEFLQPIPVITTEGETAASLPLPLVQIVDMRNELKMGNHSIFSRSLQTALKTVLERKQQAILFLNRRGSATYVFCRSCGKALICPRCDLPLTLHEDQGKLICHICGYSRQIPQTCPSCGKSQIGKYGGGTQKVEGELARLFPQARILRWDADSARQKGAEELLLSHFANHHADFLIGTQMLAKGLDIPLVTLVGIVLADVGMNFPDYRASERSFQVLTQVAGRSGRSLLGGQVILQTYQPDHSVIKRVSRHDFNGFYSDEIINRRDLAYPPFTQLIRLEIRHTDPGAAARKAEDIFQMIKRYVEKQHLEKEIILSGPIPPFFARIRGYYRQQIILRGKDPRSILKQLPLEEWRIEVNPPDLL